MDPQKKYEIGSSNVSRMTVWEKQRSLILVVYIPSFSLDEERSSEPNYIISYSSKQLSNYSELSTADVLVNLSKLIINIDAKKEIGYFSSETKKNKLLVVSYFAVVKSVLKLSVLHIFLI